MDLREPKASTAGFRGQLRAESGRFGEAGLQQYALDAAVADFFDVAFHPVLAQ